MPRDPGDDEVSGRICRYCRQPSGPGSATCPHCGAPADATVKASGSGWIRLPPIQDMTRLQLGESRCQIAGTVVPVAEFDLARDDTIYFPHHVLLWADTAVELDVMALDDWNRSIGGLRLVMLQARGPGRIALSDNHAGELVALPLHPRQQMWVHENRFVCALGTVHYGWDLPPMWYQLGDDTIFPMGGSADVFTARNGPGLVLLHSPGNTFVRDLRADESLLVQPGSLLYRDPGVHAQLHLEYLRMDVSRGMTRDQLNAKAILARLAGQGRVAVQSIYPVPPDNGRPIRSHTQASTRNWLVI